MAADHFGRDETPLFKFYNKDCKIVESIDKMMLCYGNENKIFQP